MNKKPGVNDGYFKRLEKQKILYAIHMPVTTDVSDMRTAEIYLNIRFKRKKTSNHFNNFSTLIHSIAGGEALHVSFKQMELNFQSHLNNGLSTRRIH